MQCIYENAAVAKILNPHLRLLDAILQQAPRRHRPTVSVRAASTPNNPVRQALSQVAINVYKVSAMMSQPGRFSRLTCHLNDVDWKAYTAHVGVFSWLTFDRCLDAYGVIRPGLAFHKWLLCMGALEWLLDSLSSPHECISENISKRQVIYWYIYYLLVFTGKLCTATSTALGLCSHISPPAEPGLTPLWSAIKKLDQAAVTAALRAGADPNERDSSGDTPLLMIARAGHYKYPPSEIPLVSLPVSGDCEVNKFAGQ